MNTKTAALVLGVVLVLVGILGFIPNPIVGPDGIFAANMMHNVMHIISGAVLLAGVYTSLGSKMALMIIGWVYAVVAVCGFFFDDMMFGIMMNGADRWLHVLVALVILGAAYFLPSPGMDRK